MKPASFRYHAPETLEEALDILAEDPWEAKILAGGQSLIPAMNFRLAQPTVLVDLNRIAELAYVRPADEGGLRIGAMTRQSAVESHPLVAERAPLVHETMPHIAHPQIRNRGTFGGSIAHADPASELPAVARVLDATLCARSRDGGERSIPSSDFFFGLLTTALEPGEVLTEVLLPPPPPRTGCAFDEMARRHGDYALVGVAASVTLGDDGRCADARVGLLSVGEGPVLAAGAAEALIGEEPSVDRVAAAAKIAAQADIDPPSDLHASAAFRRHLVRVLVRRVVERAVERARLAGAPA